LWSSNNEAAHFYNEFYYRELKGEAKRRHKRGEEVVVQTARHGDKCGGKGIEKESGGEHRSNIYKDTKP